MTPYASQSGRLSLIIIIKGMSLNYNVFMDYKAIFITESPMILIYVPAKMYNPVAYDEDIVYNVDGEKGTDFHSC